MSSKQPGHPVTGSYCVAGLENQLSPAGIVASAADAANRGRVWSMLGLMRLHLVLPPKGGQDPARRPALKAEFLSGIVSDILEPELEVRRSLACHSFWHQADSVAPATPQHSDESEATLNFDMMVDTMSMKLTSTCFADYLLVFGNWPSCL